MPRPSRRTSRRISSESVTGCRRSVSTKGHRTVLRLAVVPEHVVHPGLLGGWELPSHPVQGGARMKLHGNARTCPHSRSLIVRRRAEGERGLADRSSAPRRIPHRTPASRVQAIVALRRVRMTAAEIAELLSMALSTVSAILKRVGLGRLSRLAPPEPANRYERRGAGELLHVDVKKLGRIARPGHRISGRSVRATPGYHRQVFQHGWEYVHVCVDDATRLADVEVLADERGETAAAFLERALAWYEGEGVRVERVMTDNGSAYRSRVHAEACARLGLRHLTTRPYRPRTNGKACVSVLGCRPVGRRGCPLPSV